MNTKVSLNQALVKQYYRDLFFRSTLYVMIAVLVVGSTAAGYYLFNSKIAVGISLEVVTLFTLYALFQMNHNQEKVALNDLALSEKEYNFTFDALKMTVRIHKEVDVFDYSSLKLDFLKHFARFRYVNGKTNKIYIIPLTNFNEDEWKTLRNDFKNSGKEEGQKK